MTEKGVTEMTTDAQTTTACATCGGTTTRDFKSADARHSTCSQGHVTRWGNCSANRDHAAHQWGHGGVGQMHCSGVAMKHGRR